MLHPAMNGVLKNIILVTRLIFRPSQLLHLSAGSQRFASVNVLIGAQSAFWTTGFQLFNAQITKLVFLSVWDRFPSVDVWLRLVHVYDSLMRNR